MTTNYSADAIRTAAFAFEAEYPEAVAVIETGTPFVDVSISIADSLGRTLLAVVTPGIMDSEGKFVACAAEPKAFRLRRFDGRISRTETAKRATRYLGIDKAEVPIRYREVGI